MSNATIEHVGSEQKQRKMLDNIIKLSKKVFVISTPNRNYPFRFSHKNSNYSLVAKKFHRKILRFIGLYFFAKKNLNLLNKEDLIRFMKPYNLDYKRYIILNYCISSNLVLIGIKK